MKLLIPDTLPPAASWPPAVSAARYDHRAPIPDESTDAEFLVVWGNPTEQLTDCARRLTALRWVQDIASGTDKLQQAGFARRVVMTNGRSLHDGPVAEHALALALCAVRRLDRCRAAQSERRWAPELGGIQPESPARRLSSLTGATVLVWGFGSIAATLAPMLTALGAEVIGVARTPGYRHGYRIIGQESVADILPIIDMVVMVLPGHTGTRRVLDAQKLSLLPRHAWVVNVGRGSTIDEQALHAHIARGDLGGAALDVFEHEPLPPTSPLWTNPDVIISPHAAGGRPVGAERLIKDNLHAILDGRPMRNLVPHTSI
jgi:phosphoglycerate dehydrogenase-like enzyme